MELIINGDRREFADDTTVEAVVRDLTGAEAPGGVAVAVNDEVVRRTAWSASPLNQGDRVDVLTAVQGG